MVDKECQECKRFYSGSCDGVADRGREEITIENSCSGFLKREEVLKREYEDFLKTDKGKVWKEAWQMRFGTNMGDFGDYLYDFYPEFLV